jgi:hypothetical protein
MSTLKVDTILKRTGTGTITLGQSGDTVALGSGASQTGFGGENTPAFYAKRTATQAVAANTWTKIQYNSEEWDTASAYDSSSNYRFTPQTAGKYFYSLGLQMRPDNGTGNLVLIKLALYKNGSIYSNATIDFRNDRAYEGIPPLTGAINLNGSSDYIEGYTYAASNSDSALTIRDTTDSPNPNWFTASKLIGV